MMEMVCGRDEVRKAFTKSFLVSDIMDLWTNDIPAFRAKASKYFLYE